MRKKIKQLMTKEEGFTLVELLAVIVILGIIVAISIPAIGGVIDRAGDDADAAEATLVEDAARLYDVENDIDATAGVTVTELIEAGYLDDRDSAGLAGTVKKVAIKDSAGVDTDGFEYVYTP